jgi:hypothetical protein
MNSFLRVPVTTAVFVAMTVLLSGCIAYDAASTVVDAGATVVGTTVDVAGDIVTSPFDSSEPKKK